MKIVNGLSLVCHSLTPDFYTPTYRKYCYLLVTYRTTSSCQFLVWVYIVEGEFTPKLSMGNMIEQLLKSFLVYHSSMFEAWKVPKTPTEVSCDVTQHLVAYRTAVGTRTNSSTRGCSACMDYFCLISCTKRAEIVQKLTTSQRNCAVQRELCIVF